MQNVDRTVITINQQLHKLKIFTAKVENCQYYYYYYYYYYYCCCCCCYY